MCIITKLLHPVCYHLDPTCPYDTYFCNAYRETQRIAPWPRYNPLPPCPNLQRKVLYLEQGHCDDCIMENMDYTMEDPEGFCRQMGTSLYDLRRKYPGWSFGR